MRIPVLIPGMIVKHYKGNLYRIIFDSCLDIEGWTDVVIYSAINNPNKVYSRPVEQFYDIVNYKGHDVQRFVEHDLLPKMVEVVREKPLALPEK